MTRRVNIVACRVIPENAMAQDVGFEQLDLFSDYKKRQQEEEKEKAALKREKNMQKAIIEIKNKYGKNAVVRGMNLQEGATTISRNSQVGGHKA